MGSGCKSIVFAILAITFLSLAIVCLIGFIILPVLYTQLSYEEQEQAREQVSRCVLILLLNFLWVSSKMLSSA